MLLHPPGPIPSRTPYSLARLRERMLVIDHALARTNDPTPLLARAAALAGGADGDRSHAKRVGELAGALARRLRVSPLAATGLSRAAELHDVGKVALPRSLLDNPGPLSPTQRQQLVAHTRVATWLLRGVRHPVLRLAHTVARSHHERWDGAGYPDGTSHRHTPLPARIVAAADVWDALTHDRPYRRALRCADAAQVVLQMSGSSLDPRLVDAMLSLVL